MSHLSSHPQPLCYFSILFPVFPESKWIDVLVILCAITSGPHLHSYNGIQSYKHIFLPSETLELVDIDSKTIKFENCRTIERQACVFCYYFHGIFLYCFWGIFRSSSLYFISKVGRVTSSFFNSSESLKMYTQLLWSIFLSISSLLKKADLTYLLTKAHNSWIAITVLHHLKHIT